MRSIINHIHNHNLKIEHLSWSISTPYKANSSCTIGHLTLYINSPYRQTISKVLTRFFNNYYKNKRKSKITTY